MRKIKLGGKSPPSLGIKYRRVSRRNSRKPKQDHHQRVGPLLLRPLLQAPAGEGLQALIRMKAARLLIFFNSYQFIMMQGYSIILKFLKNLLCILSAVGRTGINPVPTADECCNAFIIKQLCCFSFYNSAFRTTSEIYKCDVATDEVDYVFCRTFAMENKTRGRTLNHQLKN